MEKPQKVLFKVYNVLLLAEDYQVNEQTANFVDEFLKENQKECGWTYDMPLSQELYEVCKELGLDIE